MAQSNMISFGGFYGCLFGLCFTQMAYDDVKEAYKYFKKGIASNKKLDAKIELYTGLMHSISSVAKLAIAYYGFSFIIHDLQNSTPKPKSSQKAPFSPSTLVALQQTPEIKFKKVNYLLDLLPLPPFNSSKLLSL